MTDGLTDAVRRIKQLQNDVERLKSAENEEGEPRLIFNAQERATATDQQTDLRKQREISGSVDDGRYSTSLYNSTTYE
jgi:hypothetical protein